MNTMVRVSLPGQNYVSLEGAENFDLSDSLDGVEVSVLLPRYVQELSCSGRTFKFLRPACVVIDHDCGSWVHEYHSLRIFAHGETLEDSWRSFCEEFAACWDGLATMNDGELTEDAVEMKGVLTNLVRAVEEHE
jgi:hypothetical protein